MSEHEAPSAIMWAVVFPDGRRDFTQLYNTASELQLSFNNTWIQALEKGYRCIRVKVTEVGDA